MNNELIEKLKEVLGSAFVFYMKAHGFHWNVTGPNFPQYHEFFGDLYAEVWASLDDIAEHIRAIEGFAPMTLARMTQLSVIAETSTIPEPIEMFRILLNDNTKLIEVLKEAYKMAEDAEECGLSNFLQDRIDIHKKHGWMLRSTAKAT